MRVVLGILGLLIAVLGLVGAVFGYYAGGLSDDPQAQRIFGVGGAVLLVVGIYMLYRSMRRRHEVA